MPCQKHSDYVIDKDEQDDISNIRLMPVADILSKWRKSKNYVSEPIPHNIKQKIYYLCISGRYRVADITKQLKLSRHQLDSIKFYFGHKPHEHNTNSSHNLELLPFKIVPGIQSNNDKSQANLDQKNELNDPVPNSTCIVINKICGDNLQLPSTLPESFLMQIINVFLCSK